MQNNIKVRKVLFQNYIDFQTSRELNTFQQLLPHYFEVILLFIPNFQLNSFLTQYCKKNTDTLITRYYGLHKLNEMPVVIMGNVFETNRKLHEVYDLKGSTIGRTNPTGKGVLKDLDFSNNNRRIRIGSTRKQRLLAQIERDVQFLQRNSIIDYSLLVGVHRIEGTGPIMLRSNEPFYRTDDGGMLSDDGREIYYFGIIDTLITYGRNKFLEHQIKSVWYGNEHGVSVVDPDQYATRFLTFVSNVFS